MDATPRGRPSASYSTCLDNLVDVMYGRHAQQAQPLPSGSKGSHDSVSWGPTQSLSICTDSGMSADYSRTPCSHGKRVLGGQRHGTGGYRQVCAAEDGIASRLKPPGASASWQPLSGSHPPSRCLHTAESSWMLSPLGVCALQSACIPAGRQHKVLHTASHYMCSPVAFIPPPWLSPVPSCGRIAVSATVLLQDTEENCSSVQNSPAGSIFRRIRSSSTGCTPPDHKSRAVGDGVFMRQPDLAAGAKAAESGTPSLWPGQKAHARNTNTAEYASAPKSAVLVAKDCAHQEAAHQGGHDIGLNPFSMFCATQTGSEAGVSAVPSPVKAKLRRNLFGPD